MNKNNEVIKIASNKIIYTESCDASLSTNKINGLKYGVFLDTNLVPRYYDVDLLCRYQHIAAFIIVKIVAISSDYFTNRML